METTMQTQQMSWLGKLLNWGRCLIAQIDRLGQPAVLLGIRLYIANVFFSSGLTKIDSWETTVLLFEEEYKVPLLPPQVAAALGTGGELALPVLLVLGLAGRFGAVGLTILNAVALLSYYDALNEATRLHHWLWGALILVVMAFGPGKLSIDAWLKRRWAGPRAD
ncbi:putative oxidoreductase [Chitinivorax tropicus]|uniref:Putative oxidoreductase n=1 Tax=Chitinivorax tropicus TaxID=714531 RepID=A0A840MSD1_9PROT|nr:DoxX family protein [Chitinivorax tropicus]MBB5019682.1 putative oxidoreductase [Chitinivorax tropicus]